METGAGCTGTPKIRVLIVDDHSVVREGIRRVLEGDEGLEVVGEACNGEDAIEKACKLSPDVITMDLRMPSMSGIQVTREIRRRCPDANILVLTAYADDLVGQALVAGASGYLMKDSSANQIRASVRDIHHGFSPISPSLTRDLLNEYARLSQASRSSLLTERQAGILQGIAQGLTGREIGGREFLSHATVKREFRRIYDSLGVSDRASAVAAGIKKGLISP